MSIRTSDHTPTTPEVGAGRTGPAVATARGLVKTYGSGDTAVHALAGIDVDFTRGELTAIMGPSGSGKSTLMHCMAGLDTPTSGSVVVDGEDVGRMNQRQLTRLRRTRLGLVFQQFNLVPSLSVADNLAFQARLAGRSDPAWLAELIARLGLDALLKRYPEQLSGGQQQRVAIGRALALKPALLLADEPTGNLDETTADEVVHLLRDLVVRTGCGLLMVTHSARLAAMLDRRLHLSNGLLT